MIERQNGETWAEARANYEKPRRGRGALHWARRAKELLEGSQQLLEAAPDDRLDRAVKSLEEALGWMKHWVEDTQPVKGSDVAVISPDLDQFQPVSYDWEGSDWAKPEAIQCKRCGGVDKLQSTTMQDLEAAVAAHDCPAAR